MTLFWICYISIGIYIMLPAIISVWESEASTSPAIKTLAYIFAILVWPLVFIPGAV